MTPVEAPPRREHANRQPTPRRTVVIRGQVAPPAPPARRGRPRRPAERIAGASPDRAALWAVLMGVFLIAIAVLTAHP